MTDRIPGDTALRLIESGRFTAWLAGLRDRKARMRIAERLDRLRFGNPGDVRSVGGGVSELRLHFGPGYRIYFTRIGERIIFLLAGGDKGSQARDIAAAQEMAVEARKIEWPD